MQKKWRTLALMVFVFALSMAVGAVGTADTASAKTVKAKTLKLKKKKLSIKVGEKKTLKVTVKPKKAKLTYKSNKKKIAAVSKKGVVTGKKKGTAKITVTSGKKKAVCKVKVKQTYSIKSVQVVNSKVVRVTLNKAKSLKASNFVLTKKSTGSGTNYRTLSIASVNNSKNKVYDLVLSTDYDADSDINYIADSDYVKVSVKKLNGVQTKEVVYYASTVPVNEYIGGVTGEAMNENVYFQSSYKGYLSNVKVTGLPAGLTAKAYGNYVTIKGVPSAVANGKAATMTAKDELGKSLTQKIYFYIGSASQIVSYIPFEGRTILTNNGRSKYFYIYAYGGSGSYTYTLVNNSNKYIDSDGSEIYFSSCKYNNGVKEYMSSGKYNIAYSVTDRSNTNIKTSGSLAVTAVNGVKISGKITAGDNTVLTDASVYAEWKDPAHTYYNSYLYAYVEDEDDTANKIVKGNYYLTVYPSVAYTITAESDGAERGVVNYNPGTSNHTLNFALPIYKVTLNIPSILDISDYGLRIEGTEGGTTAYSNTVYLKKGTYTINTTEYVKTGSGFSTRSEEYKFSAGFTVNGNMTVNVTAAKTGNGYDYYTMNGTISADTEYSVSDGYYVFTPTEDGIYTLTSDDEQYCTIYDMERNYLEGGYISDSTSSYTTTTTLTKGTSYVIYFDYSSTVKITKWDADSSAEEE